MRILEAGPPDGPVVILTHGFPELAYSWRHQIPALAKAGYRVIAPDQRGYGGSTRPEAIEAYDIAELTGDVVGLLDYAGAERGALVGHDWGAVVAWSTPLLHPDRVAAVAGLAVPPVPRPLTPVTEALRRIFGDNFFYMLYFQQPGVADAEMDADPRRSLRGCWVGCGHRRMKRPRCECWHRDPRDSSTGYPSRTDCRTGWPPLNSSTTSPNSAVPASPGR